MDNESYIQYYISLLGNLLGNLLIPQRVISRLAASIIQSGSLYAIARYALQHVELQNFVNESNINNAETYTPLAISTVPLILMIFLRFNNAHVYSNENIENLFSTINDATETVNIDESFIGNIMEGMEGMEGGDKDGDDINSTNIHELIKSENVSSLFHKIVDYKKFTRYLNKYLSNNKGGKIKYRKAVFKVLQSLILSKLKEFRSKSKKYKKFLDKKNKKKFEKNIKIQLKRVSSKNFVKNVLYFSTSQEIIPDEDEYYDSYTEFFRNVFGYNKLGDNTKVNIRKLYLNRIADTEQCNIVITAGDHRLDKRAKKINDYIETTKCYICGKPLKVRNSWEYTGKEKLHGYGPKVKKNKYLKKLWETYGKWLGVLLPKDIVENNHFIYFVESAFKNTTQDFEKLLRREISREFGDDFKWNILKKILKCEGDRPVKSGKKKKPACWFNFQSCLRPLECEHIFSIFTAMQHLWIVRNRQNLEMNRIFDKNMKKHIEVVIELKQIYR